MVRLGVTQSFQKVVKGSVYSQAVSPSSLYIRPSKHLLRLDGLRLGGLTLSESVLSSSGDVFEVLGSACASGSSSNGLDAPGVCKEFSVEKNLIHVLKQMQM